MKKWWSVMALFLLAMVFSAQAPQKEDRPAFAPDEVVVKLKTVRETITKEDAARELAREMNLTVVHVSPKAAAGARALAAPTEPEAVEVVVFKDGSSRGVEQLVQTLKSDARVE